MKEKIDNLSLQADKLVVEEKYETAIEVYKQILELDADKEIINFNIAELYHRLGNLTEAMNYYLYVLELNPDNKRANVKIDMINSIMNYFNTDMYNP